MRFRTSRGSWTTSWPSTLAVPEVGIRSVISILIVVVLPAPFGPSRPKSSLFSISKLTPRTASISLTRRRIVRVSVTRNEEPARWGWRLLGLDVPLEHIVGFPVVEATVDHPGQGYAAVMGWVQVVRYEVTGEPETVVLADVAPQLQGLGMPYVAFGVRPTYF